jgi:hypothetical protein
MVLSDKHWVLTAVVEAAPEAVFQHIVAMKQQEVRALGNDYQDALTTDDAHLTCTLTGHWWYQGIHTVHSHQQGAQVTYTVRNVAQVARTLAFLQRPNFVKQMRHDFERLLQQLGSQLGCSWRLEQAS